MELELFKTIKDYENYEVSSFGIFINMKTGKILKQYKDSKGYKFVSLCKEGKQKHFRVHRLVAEAFIPNVHNKPCVDHIDGNRINNDHWNLRWATNSENQCNRGIQKNNPTGVKGIHKRNGYYEVLITYNKVKYNLGLYDTLIEATIVRKLKAEELQGEFMHRCEKLTKDEMLNFLMKKMEI